MAAKKQKQSTETRGAKEATGPVITNDRRIAVDIEADRLKPAEWNVHDAEDKTSETFRGLVESIRANGIIHRIIVRKLDGGRFEIIDGHRRYLAAKQVGMKEIPCEVVGASDEDAKLLTVTANVQRIDNDPFLEAELIGMLLKKNLAFREIAARMGKGEAYVRRRARLLSLTEPWKDLAKRCPCSYEMLENVASHTPELQNRVAEEEGIAEWEHDEDDETLGWEDVESSFKAELRSLDDAPFDTKDCTNCPYNTDSEALLFPFLSEGGGRCQNAGCFAKKWDAYIDKTLADIKAKGKPAIEVADRWHIPNYWETAETEDSQHPQAYLYVEGGLRRIRWAKKPERKQKDPTETHEQKAARKLAKARERALSEACHRVRDAFREANKAEVARKMRSIFLSDETAFSEAADYFAAKACGYATLDECATLVRVCGGPAQFARTFLGDAAAFTDAERDALTVKDAPDDAEDGDGDADTEDAEA